MHPFDTPEGLFYDAKRLEKRWRKPDFFGT
jgi:hypothetical protein